MRPVKTAVSAPKRQKLSRQRLNSGVGLLQTGKHGYIESRPKSGFYVRSAAKLSFETRPAANRKPNPPPSPVRKWFESGQSRQ